MERTTVFSAVLVINIFSIADSADHDNTALHVKQDAIVAHAQAIGGLGIMEMLDVAVQPLFQTFDLAKNLGTFAGGQAVEVSQSRRAVFNLITLAVHDLQFEICARQKFYQEKTTPAAAASRRTRRAANQNPNGIPSQSPAVARRGCYPPNCGCVVLIRSE